MIYKRVFIQRLVYKRGCFIFCMIISFNFDNNFIFIMFQFEIKVQRVYVINLKLYSYCVQFKQRLLDLSFGLVLQRKLFWLFFVVNNFRRFSCGFGVLFAVFFVSIRVVFGFQGVLFIIRGFFGRLGLRFIFRSRVRVSFIRRLLVGFRFLLLEIELRVKEVYCAFLNEEYFIQRKKIALVKRENNVDYLLD